MNRYRRYQVHAATVTVPIQMQLQFGSVINTTVNSSH